MKGSEVTLHEEYCVPSGFTSVLACVVRVEST